MLRVAAIQSTAVGSFPDPLWDLKFPHPITIARCSYVDFSSLVYPAAQHLVRAHRQLIVRALPSQDHHESDKVIHTQTRPPARMPEEEQKAVLRPAGNGSTRSSSTVGPGDRG